MPGMEKRQCPRCRYFFAALRQLRHQACISGPDVTAAVSASAALLAAATARIAAASVSVMANIAGAWRGAWQAASREACSGGRSLARRRIAWWLRSISSIAPAGADDCPVASHILPIETETLLNWDA
jgi:hypothetical protein